MLKIGSASIMAAAFSASCRRGELAQLLLSLENTLLSPLQDISVIL